MSKPPEADVEIVSFDMWLTIIGTNSTFNSLRKKVMFEAIAASHPSVTKSDFVTSYDLMKKETELTSERSGIHMGFADRINDLTQRLKVPALTSQQLRELESKQDTLAREFIPPLLSEKIPSLFQNIVASGRKIAIISNTGMLTGKHVKYYLQSYSLHKFITYEIYSDVLGFTKPNTKVFNELLRLTNVSPDRILHVGDNKNADYAGAKANKLRASLTPLNNTGVVKLSKLLGLN